MSLEMTRSAAFFSPDYATAKRRFREIAVRAGARLEALPLTATGPNSEELSIDIAWLGSRTPQRALVHSSGLHGVEGFAGSAVQLELLERPPLLPADTAIVFVHVLNPYGMAWLRRVNENNVDLNRNFRVDGSYQGSPAAYARLDALLNPATAPASDLFFARAAYLILRHGMTALKQAVVGGQYDFPKGLFFGGKEMQESSRKYQVFLTERLALAESAVVVDVHTGIGKFGEDTLLVESKDQDRLRSRFGPRVTAIQPGEGPAYRIEGGLQSMIFTVFSKKRPIFIGQEFGTYSGMKVLHALREENRWHHFGAGTMDHPAKRHIKEAFCPANESWRESVLNRGRQLVEDAIAHLSHD
jgi:Protein of unknown function (DUF2817)